MARDNFNDLTAFLAVARERSFTRAAAQLGVSQPALSFTIRTLEARLGLRLLTRTTRSVAPTDAGERLLQTVGPHFAGIEAGLIALTALRGKPTGNLRITSVEHATDTIIAPALAKLLPDYPDIKVEVINDYSLTDIVAERYDAGVRLGEQVAKDMIAVRIGPDFPMAVVGAPSYFAQRVAPQTPHDLTAHDCINLRLPTSGGLYSLAVRERRARVEGAGRRESGVQLRHDDAQHGPGRTWLGPPAGGMWCVRTSQKADLSGSSPTGARPFQAITSITQAAASPFRHSSCW